MCLEQKSAALPYSLVIAISAMLLGCNNGPETPATLFVPSNTEVHNVVPNLETPDDVRRAISRAIDAKRAIVFVHVDWSIMEPWHNRFCSFATSYHDRYPDDPVQFHQIDVTPTTNDRSPLTSMPGWPGTGREIYVKSGTGGCGDIIWINEGIVQHVEMVSETSNAEGLITKTLAFFNRESTDGT